MTAKRLFYVVIGCLAAVCLLGIISLIFGNKLLVSQAQNLVAIKLQNQVLNQQEVILGQDKIDVAKYSSLSSIAATIVPHDKDQALTVREIVNLASAAGVKIGSITFPQSTLGGTGTSSSSASSGGAGSSGSARAPLSQVQSVKGLSGIYQLPITVQSDKGSPVSFDQLISFLQKLENNRHTAQVSQLSITPTDATGTKLTFELIVNVYIKP